MATIHVPGIGLGPHGKRLRRATIVAAVVLAFAAIGVPFALHGLGGSGARASAATQVSSTQPVTPTHRHHVTTDPALGSQGDLPDLLPARAALSDGVSVRLGDVTYGVLRRTPDGTWRVLVRWNDRVQAVPTHGPVALSGGGSTSWVSADGVLYTRVPATGAGRFRVYQWSPQGGSTAYAPPALVAIHLGRVCFNSSFTAFGDCRTAG